MDIENRNQKKTESEQEDSPEYDRKLMREPFQKKPFFKRRIFLVWFCVFFIFVLFFTAVFGFFAYINKKSFVEYGKIVINNELPFLFEQRYIPRFLSDEGLDSQKKSDITEDDKKIIEKINSGEVLEEASSMKKSKSKTWWLNSGGIVYFSEQEFSTNIGSLPKNFYWRKLYAKTNAKDTDDGYFPQNIFRLVLRDKFKNFSQSFYFNIKNINLSKSNNRNESNGILLFNRYQDGNNLYYVGVRVDGHGIIKKKIDGKYYTMSEKEIFFDNGKYDNDKNPNLIPENMWIGIKSELENIDDETVNIKLYIDREGKGWELALEKKDKADKYGKAPFLDKGYAGIRTDFMDVSFKNYSTQNL